jgi:signal recognition particle subunit SRP54
LKKRSKAWTRKKARELEEKIRKQATDAGRLSRTDARSEKWVLFPRILEMIPGVGKQLKDVKIDDRDFAGWKRSLLHEPGDPEEREKNP